MAFPTKTAVVAGAAAAGITTYRTVARRRDLRSVHSGRPHVVTVFRPLEDVTANLPAPIAGLGDAVETEVRAAPGEHSTEISVRARDRTVSDDQIRAALREARSLLEVGDVLHPGVATTKPTLLNRPLRAATRHGREKGLL